MRPRPSNNRDEGSVDNAESEGVRQWIGGNAVYMYMCMRAHMCVYGSICVCGCGCACGCWVWVGKKEQAFLVEIKKEKMGSVGRYEVRW